jgi:F-type H+-transporting ATPase subunit delta
LNALAAVPQDDLSRYCMSLEDRGPDTGEAPVCERYDDVLPEVIDFACLLTRHGNLSMLGDIVLEYSRLVDEYREVRFAEIVTAIPLDAETRLLITKRLRDMTGVEFVLDARVEPAIVGGIVLKVGDKVIDRSVRARLQSLRDAVLDGHEAGSR